MYAIQSMMAAAAAAVRRTLFLFTALVAMGMLVLIGHVPTTVAAAAVPDAAVTVPGFVYETVVDVANLDHAHAVVADAAGNAYALTYAAGDADENWLLKLSPTGDLLYATTFGGSALDVALDLALTPAGDVIIVGYTLSDDVATPTAFQPELNGPSDAFLLALRGSDGALRWATYLGGNRSERAYAVEVADDGLIYLTGATDSADYPTRFALQDELNLAICFCEDAFVTVFNSDATALRFSSYWGGEKDDAGHAIGVDGNGNVVVAGETESPAFPLENAAQTSYNGAGDGFVFRFTREIGSGTPHVAYSTFLGGTESDAVRSAAVDAAGNVTIGGYTRSADYPTTAGAVQPVFAGGIDDCGAPPFIPLHNCEDATVTQLTADGALAYSTYLGGSLEDYLSDVALDSLGRAYVIGNVVSDDFLGGSNDPGSIYVLRLSGDGSAVQGPLFIDTVSPGGGHGLAVDDAAQELTLVGAQNVPSDSYIARLARNVFR